MSPRALEPFDLLGELPTGTVVLEASAGTGKTYAIAALVTRYIAEGRARLPEMLVITFGRAASQELRERVRGQLAEAERACRRRDGGEDPVLRWLVATDEAELGRRRRRLSDALADFDGATIATTHQFCQLVLRSLGVAGDTDAHATLVDDLDEVVTEVVADLYLHQFGATKHPPPFDHATALRLSRAGVNDPQATLGPEDAGSGTEQAIRVAFVNDVRREVDHRKRQRGILSYDDLLTRLASALDTVDSAAAERMRQRWRIVLVDEFQDTDPVQWQVLERAFHAHATLVLIGDPKQAIYAFRGGDIVTYLQARARATDLRTLATNWRADGPLVVALQRLLGGAALGDPAITVHPVQAQRTESRLHGAPCPAPLRLRVVSGDRLGVGTSGTIAMAQVRAHIAEDLAADVARLLSARPTFDGRALTAGDVAILMYSLKQAGLFQAALARHGIASVVNGGTSVLITPAGDEWVSLLEAMERPQWSRRVRAVALTAFVGISPSQLDAGGDELTDDVAERVRGWQELARTRGIAAVQEQLLADGLTARVLSRPGGERQVTDLAHLAEVLHEVSHRERLGLSGLLAWLRQERLRARTSTERTRRLDTDADAVQLVTIHGSKGLQYPVVHLPVAFDCWPGQDTEFLYHDSDGRRMLDIGGGSPPREAAAERAGEELRLTYVALTRAQSQVVAWWAPSYYAGGAGLTRLLFGRDPGSAEMVLDVGRGPSDDDVRSVLSRWERAGALTLEDSVPEHLPVTLESVAPPPVVVRTLSRSIDTEWRRTSYSGLIRHEQHLASVASGSEPEVAGILDEGADLPDLPDLLDVARLADGSAEPAAEGADDRTWPASPMEGLPAGAGFGSFVHAVLEHTDPQAGDLHGELLARVREQQRWWSVDAGAEELTEALLPLHLTPLGPLADDLRLVDLGLADRLCELDFEFPLAGGQDSDGAVVHLRDVANLLRRHLESSDPMRAYAEKLENPSLGDQRLRGYLSGSIDVVLRLGEEPRYLVVDYKTNRLGTAGEPLTAWDYRPVALTEAMLHSHYPLQALLYSVVLHRYLRWRQPGYDPERHLGGILYLYVRGMCGPETPRVADQPCGVFAWRPPSALVTELSQLLDGGLTAVDLLGPAPGAEVES